MYNDISIMLDILEEFFQIYRQFSSNNENYSTKIHDMLPINWQIIFEKPFMQWLHFKNIIHNCVI